MTGLTLAVDTSHQVAVGVADDDRVLTADVVADSRAHVEQLMPLVRTTLASTGVELADLSRIVVGLGPGPFTGLRVGVVTGWTLAATLGIPSHGICTLDVIARQWAPGMSVPDEFVVATDARRKELYWARYRADGTRIGAPAVSAAADLPDLPVVGSGAAAWSEVLGDRIVTDASAPVDLDAGLMAAIGFTLPSTGDEPLYLRRPDATEPRQRKSALPAAHGQPRANGPRLLRGLSSRRESAWKGES